MAGSSIWAPVGDKGPVGDPGPIGPPGPPGPPGPGTEEFAQFMLDTENSTDRTKGVGLFGWAQYGGQVPGGIPAPALGFWIDNGPGANIWRFRDRMFIGAATVNDGRLTNVTKDWLETERPSTINNSTLAVLSTIGQTGATFGSRTSDINIVGGMGCIGAQFWAINDNTEAVQTAYAGYFEARRKAGTGTTHCIEMDIVNQGSLVPVNPFNMFPVGATPGLWIASGGEIAATAASAALAIVNNAAQFDKGIVFHSTALAGNDGVTGSAVAIEMPRGDVIRWLYAGGNLGTQFMSTVTNAAAVQSMNFSDLGLLYRNGNNIDLFKVVVNTTYVNGVQVTPGNAGTGPEIAAIGSDASADLSLTAKGSSGNINYKNVTVVSTAGTVFGYATFKFNGTPLKIQLFNL